MRSVENAYAILIKRICDLPKLHMRFFTKDKLFNDNDLWF